MSRPPDSEVLRRYRALCVLLLVPLYLSWLGLARRSQLPAAGRPGAHADGVAIKLDPNLAPWWELSLLNGVGPERAKAIVAYREAESRRAPGQPAYRTPEDLERVAGIGPKTIEAMRAELYLSNPEAPLQVR